MFSFPITCSNSDVFLRRVSQAFLAALDLAKKTSLFEVGCDLVLEFLDAIRTSRAIVVGSSRTRSSSGQ